MFSYLSKSISQIKKNKLYFSMQLMVDLLFVFAFGFFSAFFSNRALKPLVELLELAKKRVGLNLLDLTAAQQFANMTDFFNVQKSKLILIFGFFMLVFFLIWVLFQGTNWWMSKVIQEKKNIKFKSILNYLWRFSKINLFWMLLLFIIWSIFIMIAIPSDYSIYLPLLQKISLYGGSICSVILAFFMFISYIAIDHQSKFLKIMKNTWKLTRKYFFKILLFYIIFDLVYFIFIFLQNALSVFGSAVVLIIGLLTSLPLLSFGRISFRNLFSSKK